MYYDKRNKENIMKLADNTKLAALEWYGYCLKNNVNVLVYETIRTVETQRKYVSSGASQTMKSYHLVGQALDFVPVDEKGNTLWGGYGDKGVQGAISYAKQLGFEWGGDWSNFVDKPHLQYNHKGYGTDTFEKTTTISKPKTDVKTEIVTKPSVKKIELFQDWLNDNYKTGLKTDNLFGNKTKTGSTKALQTELNKQFNARLVVDGKFGDKTKAAIRTVAKGDKGSITRIIQGMLYCLGYDPKGFDGIYGNGCENAVESFQKNNGLSVDGKAGKNTFSKLFK